MIRKKLSNVIELFNFRHKYVSILLKDNRKQEGYLLAFDFLHQKLYLYCTKGVFIHALSEVVEIKQNARISSNSTEFISLASALNVIVLHREYLKTGSLAIHSKIHFVVYSGDNSGGNNMPDFFRDNKKLMKFWQKRYWLFSKFDEGIMLDEESYYSVTAEKVAEHIAKRFATTSCIIDLFAGCGGNTIQFSRFSRKVFSVEIDEKKLSMLQNNANVYCSYNIEPVCGNVFAVIEELKNTEAKVRSRFTRIFMSPPWGGPGYLNHKVFDLKAFVLTNKEDDYGSNLFDLILSVLELRICTAVLLPRNTNTAQLIELAGSQKNLAVIEQEYHMINNKPNTLCVYFWFDT